MPMRSVIDRIGHGYYKQHYNYGMANIIFCYMRDNIEEEKIVMNSKWNHHGDVWVVKSVGITYVVLARGKELRQVGKGYFRASSQKLSVGDYYEKI